MSNKNFIIIMGIVLTIYVGLKFGGHFTNKTAFHDQERWSEVCIKGQLIYAIVLTEHSTAVNALNDEGKPIKCQIESI